MMRSLFSGVSGLKTHQTKMDVIGNNISNVNTVAYKSMSITFTDLMYQTTQKASGPNGVTGKAGQNAKQIGLGSTSGAISTAITTSGATQTTGNPFDLRITGDSFFIVRNGNTGTYNFTRDGSFYVDANGNLAMASTGYNVLGWQVDPATNDIRQDTVSSLQIMKAANLEYEPEATTLAYVSGLLDKFDTNVNSVNGKVMSLGFFDNLGYSYFAKLSIHATEDEGTYYVVLDDVTDSDGKSITETYGKVPLSDIVTLGGADAKQVVTVSEPYASSKTPSIQKISDVSIKSGATVTADKYEEIEAALEEFMSAADSQTAQALPAYTTVLSTYYDTTALTDLYTNYASLYQNGQATVTLNETSTDGGKIDVKMGLVTMDASGTKALTVDNINKIWAAYSEGTTFPPTLGTGVNQQNIDQLADAAFTAQLGTKEGCLEILKQIYPDVDFENVTKGHVDINGNFVVETKTVQGALLKYDITSGEFVSVQTNGGAGKNAILDFNDTVTVAGAETNLNKFKDITIDFSPSVMWNNNGTSTIGLTKGDQDGLGTGRMKGTMEGISIQTDGKIYGTYTNGCTKLLGQIAVAQFANAAGLEKAGNNLYQATLNSGEFDGIGIDITADDGSMTSGTLEMSNVDLANEFTEMITTQRGYQANSRIITVSDTLLEELVNLKR